MVKENTVTSPVLRLSATCAFKALSLQILLLLCCLWFSWMTKLQAGTFPLLPITAQNIKFSHINFIHT